MKRWLIPVVLAGLSLATPVFAHDVDRRAAGALRGGNPDLDRNGWVGPHDTGRIRREARREALRREEIRRHMAARAVVKHRMYHRARAHSYAVEAREAAAHARAEAHRSHW